MSKLKLLKQEYNHDDVSGWGDGRMPSVMFEPAKMTIWQKIWNKLPKICHTATGRKK